MADIGWVVEPTVIGDVQNTTVIPKDKVSGLPTVPIDETRLSAMGVDIVQ